ncbi:two-component system, OmpR family, KDP operon response regulator KdpE [Arsukibacterium tuosuense]|uniref:Phosphate regulon transcriptional regulatory protein PhoB n=1 Tax=Arsukibacterium tuosuense TaxID=1323745 RepID=A0A285IQC2_9GAMM|nr:response regulator transcription factor [Arsukibacterium tuosuense]SNY50043.1 two-component system, OmpR family, KDP operon response regulator KdpE [Arsukibacterium tuosuense]
MAETILVLEDDPAMQSFLTTLLKSQQHQVLSFSAGLEALQCLVTQPVDLILLDLGLTDMDGQDWLQQLRNWSETPVIIISARHSEHDKVQALDNGANDYVTKPFSAAELMARVRANLRKVSSNQQVFSFGDVQLDPVSRTVSRNTQPVHLTKTEYDILLLLMRNADKVLTHNQILSQVWGKTYIDRPEYVRVHMAQLRQKLEANPAAPSYLKTEPGVGYRLKVANAGSSL